MLPPAPSATAESPFAWRGVIQGQYGTPFSAAQRRRLLRFEGRHGFNAYVHAPKGDPYQRTLWRDPYPPDQQDELDAEVALAAKLGIDWIPNVSPATPALAEPGRGRTARDATGKRADLLLQRRRPAPAACQAGAVRGSRVADVHGQLR